MITIRLHLLRLRVTLLTRVKNILVLTIHTNPPRLTLLLLLKLLQMPPLPIRKLVLLRLLPELI